MLNLSISPEIRECWGQLAIGALTARVNVHESPESLKNALHIMEDKVKDSWHIEDISKIPEIKAGREAYKAFGKKPARYRLSSEALMRRILKDQGLSLVNNIVDINNLLSLQSRLPICAFDLDSVFPPVTFTLGMRNDYYEGIGRGSLNIENLPVFGDTRGKFGSPTSDSERVKITPQTHHLSMNIISFSGDYNLEFHLANLGEALVSYAEATEIEKKIIH